MGGCNMMRLLTGHSFKGQVEPGKACMVERNGQNHFTWIVNSRLTRISSLAGIGGRDPETDEHIWGSLAGRFQFRRKATLCQRSPRHFS